MTCYQLTEEIIEHYMKNLMKLVETNSSLFPTFDENDLITILHNVQNLYAAEPIMLQFDLPKKGLVVVGDLHGDLYCLLNILLKNGFPPNANYLFLGDYVDRGLYQVQLILFIFLMKLRWPNYVTTLKGNHEDYQCGKEYEFYDQCMRMFKRGRRWYTLINHVFDHMPVCAIISDHFFVCHGGISQWMTCRSNIRNIPKPTYTNDMYFIEGVLLADLLWADPVPQQKKWFALSQRNCGYTFNRYGLIQVLRSMKLTTLIRGHEYYRGGTARNFGDETCYTVHSTTDQQGLYEPYSGTLTLEKMADTFVVVENNELIQRNGNAGQLARQAQMEMQHSFLETVISYNHKTCHWCEQPYPLYVTRRKRCFMYNDILDYMMKNGQFVLFAANLCGKLSWRGTFWRGTSAMKRAIDLFPMTLDMIFGKSDDDDFPRTFRVCISEEEYKLMEKIYKAKGIDMEFLMPKFQTISDAHMELQMPTSRFQKLKRHIKLAMGLEPHKLESEYLTAKPAALPLSSSGEAADDEADVNEEDLNEAEGRTLNIATGSNQPYEVEEEPDDYVRSMPSDVIPFDSTLFYQRTREPPLDDFPSSSKLFDTHDFARNHG
ncbi:Ser/Thr phosphatase family protein [Onchocerca flexuosa]|uniref:Serine/threonine-protein phosphatase n=1 Tax=Onchocerca flexuosa TaxID=387005 RepID=A0A238BHQ5_9BILA|nr:Ser/Thr phosphatase family protein [Onchocerca flexuosa]